MWPKVTAFIKTSKKEASYIVLCHPKGHFDDNVAVSKFIQKHCSHFSQQRWYIHIHSKEHSKSQFVCPHSFKRTLQQWWYVHNDSKEPFWEQSWHVHIHSKELFKQQYWYIYINWFKRTWQQSVLCTYVFKITQSFWQWDVPIHSCWKPHSSADL